VREFIAQAATVEDAILEGLRELRLKRDQAEVQVLEEKVSALPSMMGYTRVRVKVSDRRSVQPQRSASSTPRSERRETPRPAPMNEDTRRKREIKVQAPPPPTPKKVESPSEVKIIEQLLSQTKEALGWTDLQWVIQERGEKVFHITLKSASCLLLADSDGEILHAFEHLMNLMLGRTALTQHQIFLRIDVAFKTQYEEELTRQAQAAAESVRRMAKVFRFDPMNLYERRFLHGKLIQEPGVETVMEGDGPWRKVVVKPKAPVNS